MILIPQKSDASGQEACRKTGPVIEHTSFALFIAFSFCLIPFSFCRSAFDPVLPIRFILLALLLLLLGTIVLLGSRGLVKAPPLAFTLLLIGYFLSNVLSIIPADNKSEALFEIGKTFLFASYTWFAALLLIEKPGRFAIVAKAVTLSSGVIALIGILEYWGIIQPITGVTPPCSMAMHRNLLASFLFLCIAFSAYTAVTCRGPWRATGLANLLLIAHALLATQSRAVWLGVAGAFACLIILALRSGLSAIGQTMLAQKKLMIVVAAIPIIALGATAASKEQAKSFGHQPLSERVRSIADPTFASNRERLLLWSKTLRMIGEHPILGVGAGNWKISLPRYGVGNLLDGAYTSMSYVEVRPYNDFLWVFSETGVFGFLCYGGILVLCAILAIRQLSAGNRRNRMAATFLIPAIVGFAIISFFDFPKERVEHLVVLGALLASCATLSRSPRVLSPVRFRIVAMAIAFAGAGSIVLGGFRLNGDIHTIRMRSAMYSKDWKSVIAESDKAYSPLYTLEPTSTPLHWYRGAANFHLGNIGEALADDRQARRNNPGHLLVLNDLGTCYSLKGDPEQAKACYKAALEISPAFEPTLVNLAAVYYNAGNYQDAWATLARCPAPHMDPRYEQFHKIISAKLAKGGVS